MRLLGHPRGRRVSPMTELVIWPAGRSDWSSCSPDHITWLDRTTLSAGRDPTLHRSPRCPGLRHVQYRWELFSRDTTHAVYLAPYADGSPGHFKEVQAQAVNTLPPALPRFETHPVELIEGAWVVVPAQAVIHNEPNPLGEAVVWYKRSILGSTEHPLREPIINCFAAPAQD